MQVLSLPLCCAVAMSRFTSHSQVELDGLTDQDVNPQVFGAKNEGLRHRSPDRYSTNEDQPEWAVSQQALDDNEKKWAYATAVTCGLDLVASTTILSVAFKYAYRDNGVSLWCMGFQAFSHELSSLLLMLRLVSELAFYRSEGAADAGLLRQRRKKSLIREQGLSVLMGCVMLISAAALLFKAFRKIKFWNKWYLDHKDMDKEAAEVTDWLAWWGFGIYTVQALFRFFAGRRLRQSLVWHCFFASVVSLAFLLVLAIAAYEEKEWSWKAEPIAAIALAFFTLVEGIRIIYNHFDDMETRLQHDPRG